MNTVKIYQLNHLSSTQYQRLRTAQQEAALVWNACVAFHLQARMQHLRWPGRTALQKATKGRFALHSQSVQMVTHAFLANVETTQQLRKMHPEMQMRYPYKEKRFYPVSWPAQAVSTQGKRVVLPMGRGRDSLVLPVELPEHSRSVKLVWNQGYELHVSIEASQAEHAPGEGHATVDLGEIHLASVTTTTNEALIVTGRGIRSLKRQRSKALRTIGKKQARCLKHSRRWNKLQRAKTKQARRAERRIRDQRHQATRKVITFCVEQQVGTLFIGNPHGVRKRHAGRHHNQRMSLWEYGRDIDYLNHKATQAHIECFTGSERGTSSQCPECGHKHKPRNRQWTCKACGFSGHRDLVGSINMHTLAFGERVSFPRSYTYLRPAKSRKSSSRADTPPRCLSQLGSQPHVADVVSLEAGYRPNDAKKPVSL
ncbi:RNA-guided endonuclease InsQ/TnpB family protein [Dictyobacter aurantiacus]|nr:transposase [Dictyobacter aurantiacus]